MRQLIQFVADHPKCSFDDVRNHFEERPLNEVETLVIRAHEEGLIDAKLTYTRMIEGDSPNFGFMSITALGQRWLNFRERGAARWRR